MGCFTMSGGEVFGEQETLGMWAFWGKVLGVDGCTPSVTAAVSI